MGCIIYSNHFQVILPDGNLPRWRHSTTAITLCPGLVEVIVFGGRSDDLDPERRATQAETTIITFSEAQCNNKLNGSFGGGGGAIVKYNIMEFRRKLIT